MTSSLELQDFLSRLSARRERVTLLVQRYRVRDASELFDEVAELGEQLMQADEELRTQQAELDEARHSIQLVATRNAELFDGSSTAYVITDAIGHLLQTNRSAAALLADPPARKVVRPFATRFAVADRSQIRSMINRVSRHADGSAALTASVMLARPDGTTLPVKASVRVYAGVGDHERRLLWELDPQPQAGAVESALSLSELLADRAAQLSAEATPAELLAQVVELAASTVPGAEHAGISLLTAGRPIETPAATSAIAEQCDQAQQNLDEGPGLQALDDGGVLVVDDMWDEPRWPRFAEQATRLGVRSLMTCQLATPRGTVGALNLYSEQPNAFDDESVLVCGAFATPAAVALAQADRELNLRQALESRETIGQAMSILMERHHLTAGAAFDVLVAASHRHHVKLREVAQHVVDAGEDPEAPPTAR